ncbi:Clavaminate synthase-like protein [Fomitopsis serialis]|uniref:Clavaminate synthase-like protein n=1 Tax=Fomitopsis serialis TaxID=139415 RepID=UPI0020087B65|nr:Clavaminate synthase-like protein [Neoantrodia serialis]KAH9921154.1 Clavaminate synthase-like protein [Neoantrodia serialis]
MPGLTNYPPFPDNVPTHPLLVVDYELLKAGDDEEIDKFWTAATTLGFWYMKNHGADELVSEMFDMGEETMDLPFEEKMNYKAPGANATDETGARDTVEFINISQDDALAFPTPVHRTYPSTVTARMEHTIRPFIQHSAAEGTLAQLHRLDETSGSETRCIRNPPRPGGISEEKAALGAHTDFGSMTFLHNRLGGCRWQYIKPIPGHAVCNLGDAMYIFSGGILKSNLHRVVPAPGAQAVLPRWSWRCSRVLATPSSPRPHRGEPRGRGRGRECPDRSVFGSGQTSKEWFARRIRNQRTKNQKIWRQSRGTEHRPDAA